MKRLRPGYGRNCKQRGDGDTRDRIDPANRFAPFGLPLGDLVAVPDDNRNTNSTRRNAAHTLVLRGELDRYSAAALEAEIERLCNTQIAKLTLDLRHLSSIDVTGVAVIVYRRAWCVRRGCEFALIEGPASVQRVFELVGAIQRLPFVPAEVAAIAAGLGTRSEEEVTELRTG